ncbi:MAG: class I SAM-dependent methyltransferase [Thermostichus sp. DG_1_6_bins_120]
MSETDVTLAVQAQYEAFPYPPVPYDQPFEGFSSLGSYTLAQYARTRTLQEPKGARFLVAGCGTGYEIHGIAASNPGYGSIVGIDISRTALEVAKRRLKHHGLIHCSVQYGDLLDPSTWPEGSFDMISSYGVIHHTANPLRALSNLAQRLAPDGVIALMLYNRSGRWHLYRIRQALELLGVTPPATPEKIQFVRQMLNAAHPNSLLATHANAHKEYYLYDENIVDNFFHANDIPFDIAEIPDFVAQAGLEFIDVAPHRDDWSARPLVAATHPEFHQRFGELSRIEQLRVIELLEPLYHTQNLFWCCHQGKKIANWYPFTAEFFKGSRWQLNPLFVQYGSVRYLDRKVPFSDLLDKLDPAQIPTQKMDIFWQIAQIPGKVIASSRYQVLELLLPLAEQARSGAEILAGQGEREEHILNLFRQWEADRLVLRVA